MLTGCKHCYGRATDPTHDLHTLSNQPCATLAGAPCDACRSIVSIEAEILDAQAALLRLIERHRAAREEVNMSHSFIHQRIPPEILSSIFRFCIPNNMEDNMADTVSARRSIETCMPFILGSVCKTWRTIAWSTPNLWNQVYFRLNSGKNALQTELLQKWLSRTGDLPLRIYADCRVEGDESSESSESTPTETPQIDIISRYSSRWEDLYLFLPVECLRSLKTHGGTPLLRTLLLKPYADDIMMHDKWQMPRTTAQNVSLDLRYMLDEQLLRMGNTFNVDWDTVTHLQVDTNLPKFIQPAMQARNLLYLEITSPSGDIEEDDSEYAPPLPSDPSRFQETLLSHSNIEEFKYYHLASWLNQLISFNFPAVKKIHLETGDLTISRDVESLKTSLGHSPCLTWLTLHIDAYNDVVLQILHAVPSLESLTLYDSYVKSGPGSNISVPKQLENTAVANPSRFLPNLREFACTLNRQGIPWTDMPMIFGRLDELNDPGRRPLASVVYVVSDWNDYYRRRDEIVPNPDEVRTLIPYLKSLKSANLNLEVLLESSHKSLLPSALIEQVESMAA